MVLDLLYYRHLKMTAPVVNFRSFNE
uniref:Uncharacterized protein n=1 Tax=Tetranychus urticae TaxID=32264 RepID=T1L4Z0_TETUR